jgi:hemerythrin-like domain-containing protein
MGTHRREFLVSTTVLGISGLAGRALPAMGGPPSTPAAGPAEEKKGKPEEEGVSAPEDLMREHAVLERILLIYAEATRRLQARRELPSEVLHRTATLVRKFIEDYHSKLEEDFVFPQFERRGRLVSLIKVLKEQHAAGRLLTDVILADATADGFGKADARQRIVRACEAFIRMYHPHTAREGSVLFPALREILPASQLEEMGDQFEKEENRLFGDEGFEKTVEQVAAIERQLGIDELGQFTPKPLRN